MVSSLDTLDLSAIYSYADYLSWQFEERVELIKGKIFPMSAPSSRHQEMSGNLYVIFHSYFKKNQCKVFAAPFDVRLPKKERKKRILLSSLIFASYVTWIKLIEKAVLAHLNW